YYTGKTLPVIRYGCRETRRVGPGAAARRSRGRRGGLRSIVMDEERGDPATFLFTRLESDPAGTPVPPPATRPILTLLRRTIVQHGGEVIPTSGAVGLGARFATAQAALSAALAAQHAAEAEPTLDAGPIRLSMAFDTAAAATP